MPASIDWLDSADPNRYVDQLWSAHSRRRTLDDECLRYYWGTPQVAGEQVDIEDTDLRSGPRLTPGFNITRMLIDSWLSLTVRQSAIKVVPIGAKFTLQRSAKNMEKFIRGVMSSVDFADKLYRAAMDACTVRPGGVLKWFVRDDQVGCEKSDPTTYMWDFGEGSEPSRLVQLTYAPKHRVAAMFPMMKREILGAPTESPRTIQNVDLTTMAVADRCRVVEVWSLPQGKKKGRHEIIVGRNIKVIPEDERIWTMPMFPVVFYRAKPSYRDFAGKPLAEGLIKYQRAVNRAVKIILDSAEGCVPRTYQQANEDHETLTRLPFEKVIYQTTAPEIKVANTIPEQQYQLIDVIKRNAAEEMGIAETSISGQKPSGLTAAVSIREANDIQSQRLYHPTRALEDFQKACAKVIIWLSKDAYKKKAALYRAPGSDLIEEMRLQDIDLREDQYDLEASAASSFPTTSAARRQTITELEEGGYITKAEALRMMEIVDVEATLGRANARRDYAEGAVSQALFENKLQTPSEYLGMDGLTELAEIGKLEFLKAQMSYVDTPKENLNCLRKLIAAAEKLSAPTPAVNDLAAPLLPEATATGGVPLPGGEPALGTTPPPGPVNPVSPVAQA